MVKYGQRLLGWLLGGSGLLLSGCFAVSLPPENAPDGLQKLTQLSDATLPVRIKTGDLAEGIRGFQYLFMAVPFSRVYTPTLKRDLILQLSVAGGMRGYAIDDVEETESRPLLIEIDIHSLSVNGYDLLFIRKPTASISLTARMYEHGVLIRECPVQYSASDAAQFAFTTELQNALSEALLQSSYRILDCFEINEIPAIAP